MFFLLSKILAFVLSPVIWILTFLLLSLFSKKPKRKKGFLVTSVLLFLLFSNEFIVLEFLRKWEARPIRTEKIKDCDYALLLGGFSSFDTAISRMELNESGDRLWQTAQLYKQKKVKKIFITGGSGKLLHQDETEADKVITSLVVLGIPEDDIITESISNNTHENAKYTAEWLQKHDSGATCILITSAFHMKRAIGCFRKYKVNVIPFPVDIKAGRRLFDPDILFKPSAKALVLWDFLLKEMFGYVVYYIIGYI